MMKTKIQLLLCRSRSGRVAIHLFMLIISGRLGWHLSGIVREFK